MKTIEQDVYDYLVEKCGGVKNVKGISGVQLSKIKNGKSTITLKKLVEVFDANRLFFKIDVQKNIYSIIDEGVVLEDFASKEMVEYALEEFKRMGFPNATIYTHCSTHQ